MAFFKKGVAAFLAGFCFMLSAHAEHRSRDWFFTHTCPQAGTTEADWDSLNLGSLRRWFIRNGVELATPNIELKYQIQFALEFAKFPQALRAAVVGSHGRIRLVQGQAVTDDPLWSSTQKAAFDGRPWTTLGGTGGAPYALEPARIVVNRLYEKHGAKNLVLHEYAHTLDSIYEQNGISNSKQWTELWRDNPDFVDFMDDECGTYCTENPNEAFAEAMAVYYACDKTQDYVERYFPDVARFFKQLPKRAYLAR